MEPSLTMYNYKEEFMERELLISVRKNNSDDKKVDREIENIKRLFPYLESFETFTTSHEVLDLEKHAVVNTRQRLHDIFRKGLKTNRSFIISLN